MPDSVQHEPWEEPELNGHYVPTTHGGWYIAALTEDITDEVTPLHLGKRALMAVRDDDSIKVFDAICPHRGANLAYGGTRSKDVVVCPFHGKGITLGERADRKYCVPEVASFLTGNALLVRAGGAHYDRGFASRIAKVCESHIAVPGIAVEVEVTQELVIENAFDIDHFMAVHSVPKVIGTSFGETASGAVYNEASFRMRPPEWSKQPAINSRFHATAYSPSIVVTELGEAADAQVVITGATPIDRSRSVVRVLTFVRGSHGIPAMPDPAIQALRQGGIKAIEDDVRVWSHLDPDMTPTFDDRDEPVRLFRRFARGFADATR